MIVLFLAVGVSGWWGPRQGRATRSTGQLSVEVSYPRVTRGGLPAEWRVTVTRLDERPLDRQLVVSNPVDYVATFDQNAVDPVPAASWVSDTLLYWSFDVPDGVSHFTVVLDARVQPDASWRRAGTTSIVVGGERIDVGYATWVLP